MTITDLRGAVLSAADPPIATNPNPDLAIKAPVRVATTGSNITLSGLQTIDGVALAAGDRVLVKDQSDQTTNGIYNATTGSWTRTIDGNNNSQWTTGTQVAVAAGTINAGNSYKLTTAIPVILATSLIVFALVTTATIGGATPTAKVGLNAVSGTALTFIRSDGAPPIDQTIAPTWTAVHTFSAGLKWGPATAGLPTIGRGELYYDDSGAAVEHNAALNIVVNTGASAPGQLVLGQFTFMQSKGDNTTFPNGVSGGFIAVNDRSDVIAGTKGLLYAWQLSIRPQIARNNSPFDDATGLVVQNDGTAKGTDAIF